MITLNHARAADTKSSIPTVKRTRPAAQQLLEKPCTNKRHSDQLQWTLFHAFSFSLEVEISLIYLWDLYCVLPQLSRSRVREDLNLGWKLKLWTQGELKRSKAFLALAPEHWNTKDTNILEVGVFKEIYLWPIHEKSDQFSQILGDLV